jgi:excisionase family DNA binding protein
LHIVHTMSAAPLSPAQAAHRSGVSRWTISRALKAGELRGQRDNLGAWRIEPDELDAWAAHRAASVRPSASAPPTAPPAETAELRVSLARAEAEVSGLRERLADLTADRDAWRAQAQELASRRWWHGLLPPRR